MEPLENHTACHECDLLIELPQHARYQLSCPRCHSIIANFDPRNAERLLAITITALLLLIMANAFPFLAFEVSGQYQQITLLQSVTTLWHYHYPGLSILILVFILLAPAAYLLCIFYLLTPLFFNRQPRFGIPVFANLFRLSDWSMVEVFLIGVLVSLIKLAGMADVIPGISLWAYIGFSIAVTYVLSKTDRLQLWHWLHHGIDRSGKYDDGRAVEVRAAEGRENG
ncbi:paraquat-inducible protein A [Bacterioplanoides sp.]|uniref:paraquat-inducible protein A n=1 Tax=Bacterioplanoides sp. TaxID=2066072 RepID=UPI003B009933